MTVTRLHRALLAALPFAAAFAVTGCWTAPVANVQPPGEPRLIQDGIAVQSVKDHAVVESLDAAKRTIVLRTPGEAVPTPYSIGARVTNLSQVKPGDQVEVVNLRFAEVPSNAAPEPTGLMAYLQFTKDDIMHWTEELIMLLLGIVVLLTVVRPLVNRIIAPERVADAALDAEARAAIAAAAEMKAVPSTTAKMIDIAQVQGQVHAQSVQKVGELAERNPSEAVSIIRSWLHENA